MSKRSATDAQALIVTTPWADTTANRERANTLAQLFEGEFVVRNDRSIEAVFQDSGATFIVVSADPPMVYHRGRPTEGLFFHPSLAVQRVTKLREGNRDRLIDAAEIGPGDLVLDATLGLGTDSLVMAQAVGNDGRVTACEASHVLAHLFQYAQLTANEQDRRVQQLFERISVEARPHDEVLAAMADNSVDVVYFDPMFRQPPDRVSSIDPLRGFAYPTPISKAVFIDAQRVARRAVVIKERPRSGEFERFGLTPDRPRSRFAFGVWRKPPGREGGRQANG